MGAPCVADVGGQSLSTCDMLSGPQYFIPNPAAAPTAPILESNYGLTVLPAPAPEAAAAETSTPLEELLSRPLGSAQSLFDQLIQGRTFVPGAAAEESAAAAAAETGSSLLASLLAGPVLALAPSPTAPAELDQPSTDFTGDFPAPPMAPPPPIPPEQLVEPTPFAGTLLVQAPPEPPYVLPPDVLQSLTGTNPAGQPGPAGSAAGNPLVSGGGAQLLPAPRPAPAPAPVPGAGSAPARVVAPAPSPARQPAASPLPSPSPLTQPMPQPSTRSGSPLGASSSVSPSALAPGGLPNTLTLGAPSREQCPKPSKQRSKKKPRQVCHTGTYVEHQVGLTKSPKRVIKCR